MKKVLLLIGTILFSFQQAYSECAFTGVRYFPEQRAISQNSLIIIEGYYYSQKLITSFEGDRIAYLESDDGHRVDLILQEILKGQMSLTQAVFKPSEKLMLNRKYFLKFSKLSDKENYDDLTRYNREKKGHEPVYWEVTKRSAAPLNPDLTLQFEGTKVNYYGCGPAANAVFQTVNSSNAEVWYKTEVFDEQKNKSSTFILRAWEGKLNVGHGMCSGGFTFTKEGKYKVRFTPMNVDGTQLTTTEWKSFESPYKDERRRFGF